MSTREYRAGDRLIEAWDDTNRVFYRYDYNGALIEQRPYTPEEVAWADGLAAEALLASNKSSIEEALATTLVALQAIIDTPNADMTSTAWKGYVKDLARSNRRLIRLVLRRLEGTE